MARTRHGKIWCTAKVKFRHDMFIQNIVGHLTYLSNSNARRYFWKLCIYCYLCFGQVYTSFIHDTALDTFCPDKVYFAWPNYSKTFSEISLPCQLRESLVSQVSSYLFIKSKARRFWTFTEMYKIETGSCSSWSTIVRSYLLFYYLLNMNYKYS